MNDVERAKDILLDTDLYCVGYSTSELRNACDLAISALEKQLNGGWIPASDGKYIIEVKEGEVVSCQNFEI